MHYQDLLDELVETCKKLFGPSLTGVYLHGSLAMGCFHPEKSDLDLIVVIGQDITDEQKLAFLEGVVRMNACAPAKGIEMSVVKEEYCREFVYPTPYELHFSNAHLAWWERDPGDYVRQMKGTDKDLAAHFTIIREYGIPLYGPPVAELFGPVPRADYIDSIWYDVEGAVDDVRETPMYVILNLCRVAAYLEAGRIISKKTGGQWMLEQISAGRMPASCEASVKKALDCYERGEDMAADEASVCFAEYMIKKIKEMRR